jgi:hypothetical protein
MARVPTIAEEDAKRPNRERDWPIGGNPYREVAGKLRSPRAPVATAGQSRGP